MPQVDLETLVSACAGGSTDRKVSCETLADDGNDDHHIDETHRREPNPDSPPESVWLSRDEEFDWWDRNAVYERKESTKGNSVSCTNLNPGSISNSNSQRFSKNLKSKASIIGLPKPQKTSFVDAKNLRNHNKPGNARFFPKRSVSVGKSESSMFEPSSPKVSCIGRVRSKRDRNRRLRTRQRSTSDSAKAREKPARSGRKKPGFFESVRAIFRSGRRGKPAPQSDIPAADSTTKRAKKTKARACTESVEDTSFVESVPRNSVSETEPVGLGGMMRFASGRRSESWVVVGDPEIHLPQ